MASAPHVSSAAELSECACGVGDREQEVVELNSKVPVRDEEKQNQESLEVKVRAGFPPLFTNLPLFYYLCISTQAFNAASALPHVRHSSGTI
jgi:hypothetical protein